MLKQTLGWTCPKVRDPRAADTWTWPPTSTRGTVMTSQQGNVAAGTVEGAITAGAEYRPLNAIIGRWMTLGHTFGPDGQPGLPISASDIYEWAPGGFFIVHTAYGLIGEQGVGGIEIIGYNDETRQFHTTFFDSQGNITTEELSVGGTTWRWVGTNVRCTGTLEDNGQQLVCHHERLDGDAWVPSMDLTLTKVA
jgi:hypothetical protein